MQVLERIIKDIYKNKNALTPVTSAVLAILIVLSTTASIFLWGVPYIENLQSETVQENVEMQLYTIADDLKELAHTNPGERKVNTFYIADGSFSVDEEKDRNIIIYSHDKEYSFTVTDIHDNILEIKMLDSPDDFDGNLGNATIYWFDDGETCFLSGTKILMADGTYKTIEDMLVGDLVKSYDEETGKIVNGVVTQFFRHSPGEMADYYLIINNQLRVTPNHRFYSNGDWVYAGSLKVGDSLFCGADNYIYRIYSIKRVYERVQTFDLEVEYCHTYFVSFDDDNVNVLVHNADQRDQSYYADVGAIISTYDVYSGQSAAQSFTPALDSLTKIGLPLKKIGAPRQDLIISIYDSRGSGGSPGGQIESLNVLASSITTSLVWYDFNFATLSLTPGSVYYIVLETTGGTSSNCYCWGYDNNADGYHQGSFWTYIGGRWTDTRASDAYFETYGAVEINSAPEKPTIPLPIDRATGVGLSPTLSVYVEDPDGDQMAVEFWQDRGMLMPTLIGTINNVPSRTRAQINWPGRLAAGTIYKWYAVARDGGGLTATSVTWSFTTININNAPNTPSNPNPSNHSTHVWVETALSWTGGDPDGDIVTYNFYFGTASYPPFNRNNGESTTLYPLMGALQSNTTYYWKIVATDSKGASTTGPIWHFTTDTFNLSVQTLDATNVTGSSATLRGTITEDGGEYCQIQFRYRVSGGYVWSYPSGGIWHGNYAENDVFSETITGLQNHETYEFQAGAHNSFGVIYGESKYFTTLYLPGIGTNYAKNVTQTSATLIGALGDPGDPIGGCQIRFKYSINEYPDIDSFKAADLAGYITWIYPSDWHGCYTDYEIQVYESISGLTENTTYVYRAGAKNIVGEKWSYNYVEFKTIPLAVQTLNATDVIYSSAMLYGKIINDGGEDCQIRFKYSINEYPDLSAFIAADLAGEINWTYPSNWHGSYDTNDIFQEAITGLTNGISYVFCAGAKNSENCAWGDYKTFKTSYYNKVKYSISVEPTIVTGKENTWEIQIPNNPTEHPTSFSGTMCIDLYDDVGTCFLAGTKILMADGTYKTIEEITTGDQVMSYSEQTKQIDTGKVINIFHHAPKEMTAYYLIINEHLRVTPNHQFYSDGKWISADDLKFGDTLFNEDYDKTCHIYSIKRVYEKMPSFNLEIEPDHNYFVSIDKSTDVLVHNDDPTLYRFGSIWIFDSNSFTYAKPSNNRIQELTLENGGIFQTDAIGESQIKNTPPIYINGDTFSINAVQTLADWYSASGSGGLKFRVLSNLYSSQIQETKQVYYLRLQFYGDNAEAWYNYLDGSYSELNIDLDSPEVLTLLYTPSLPSAGGTWLALANSIIRMSLQ